MDYSKNQSLSIKNITETGKKHADEVSEAQRTFQDNSASRSSVGKHIADLSQQIDDMKTALEEVQNLAGLVKILSLNASIEAARAGEAGRAFGVVAEQIGTFSQNTNRAISHITNSIGKMDKLLADTASDMAVAKKIGSVFDERLENCVQNANNLYEQLRDYVEQG